MLSCPDLLIVVSVSLLVGWLIFLIVAHTFLLLCQVIFDCMPDIVNFTWFVAGYFCINYKYPWALFWGVVKLLWNSFDSFSSLFQALLDGTRAAFSPGLILQIFGFLSSCAVLSFCALPAICSFFGLRGIPASLSQVKETIGPLLGFLYPCCSLETLSSQ